MLVWIVLILVYGWDVRGESVFRTAVFVEDRLFCFSCLGRESVFCYGSYWMLMLMLRLTDCSSHEYNDGTTTSFGLNYVDSSLGYHGWQVSSNAKTKTYDYFITDMGFGFESKENYNACLQVLHNQYGVLRNSVFRSIKCPW